jgi:hypothetical protein
MSIGSLAFVVALSALSSTSFAADFLLPPKSSVEGRSASQLAADWWQWAMSAPREESPIGDMTGAKCTYGQEGPVWFLAGGFGSSKIRRACSIPAGKTLFFPVINMVYWPRRGDAAYTCPQAKAAAALNNDTALDLFAEIDGVAVEGIAQYRFSSEECFDIYARVPPERGPYKAYPAATDGYWLMVKPLSAGRHTLKFGGRYNRNSPSYGRMLQDIEYVLVVQ